ncbi:MAG: hypothetical protein LC667_11365 [Thioalkalivibrio sp.]|nr:hypothetical protein [Thioalkalivibrio sp.]
MQDVPIPERAFQLGTERLVAAEPSIEVAFRGEVIRFAGIAGGIGEHEVVPEIDGVRDHGTKWSTASPDCNLPPQ